MPRRGAQHGLPLAACVALGLLGCVASRSPAPAADTDAPDPDFDRRLWPDPTDFMRHGEAQREVVCARGGDDLVRDLFCGDEPPRITSLVELEQALEVDEARIGGYTGVSLTANSTALSTRSVSALNPRLFAVRVEQLPIEMIALAFTRGEQSVELVVRDRDDRELRFYLLAYRQSCDEREDGCRLDELLTPETESGWRELSLYDEEDLKNTALDCRQCHQPGGPGTPKLMRMQELFSPWTHWLWRSSLGGRALMEDYFAAHGDEIYGGMPAAQIDASHPGNLTTVVVFSGGGDEQPNAFEGGVIEAEVLLSARERGGMQPEDNAVPGESPTWRAIYERARAGEAIPVPYHDVKVTEAKKLAAMTEAYLAHRRGELAPGELPDIRDVFPDDPKRLAAMGFTTEPGLDGEGVLMQACAQCHNGRLDQSLSRASFDVDLGSLSRAEKDLAIERLRLPGSDPQAMPPRRVRFLSDEARERLIELLRK